MFRFIFLVFFYFLFSEVSAQQPAYFILGEKEFEGVQIYDVIQDNELNYWFATDQGFYRYDNYHFETVDCSEMKGLAAFGFVKSKDGLIFCYNLNHQIIKIEKGKCSVFYEFKENEISNDVYLSVNNSNQLLILSKTAFVFSDKGVKEKISPPIPGYYGFPYLLSDGSTISHLADTDSLLFFDGKSYQLKPFLNKGKPVSGVLKFFKMNGALYAISTKDKQIYIYKEQINELIPVKQFDELDKKEFLRFYEEGGSLWIAGTVSGVSELSQGEFIDLKGKYYNDYLISDVYLDSEGNTLLSTFNHGVIVIPDFLVKDVIELSKTSNIVSTHLDEEFGLLAGTLKGELISYSESGTKILSNSGSRPLQAIFSWKNFPYILFDDGQIKLYHKKTGQITIVNSSSLKDASLYDEKTIYLALNRGVGKLSVNPELKFDLIPDLKNRAYSIEVEPVTNKVYISTSDGLRLLDEQGNCEKILYKGSQVFANDLFSYNDSIFIATKKDGILIYKNGKFKNRIVPVLNGENMDITRLHVLQSGIFLLSNNRFYDFNRVTRSLVELNKVHGFSTNKIFDFEILDDIIWINHSKGLQKLDRDIFSVKAHKPGIYLNSVTVNTRLISVTEGEPEFNYTDRNFRFVFSSPTLRNKENIRYYFKLEGYNSEWQIADYFSNEISYNALAPGNYVFRVKAENNGVFSEEYSYAFIISEPFYFTWWFLIISAFVVILIIILFYRRKLWNQKKKAELLNQINASRLTAIQSQMNPHFIFNSLNAIQDLVLKGDIDNSYTFITKFSDLVRRTLDYSGKDFIEFEQELKLIQLYLSLEKLRFKNQLNIELDADEVEEVMIPPMLIQPFIENSILHGLLHKEGEKKLNILFAVNESLICTIEDNGIGRKASQEIKARQRADHESFSGKAIKKRFEILQEIFSHDLGFEYEDLEENGKPSGTRVILKIPLKRKF